MSPTSLPVHVLHAHTTMSMLDGASPVDEYIKYAKERGLGICSCTDHGWLSAAYDLISKSKKADIKPVPGCEFYLSPHPAHVSESIKQDGYFHLTVWAYNQTGYQNLLSLASGSWDEGKAVTRWGKPKPRISWTDLEDYGEGLIVGSGCIEGPIGKCLLNNEVEEAKLNARRLKHIFGDRLFFEVFPATVDRDYFKAKSIKVVGDNGFIYRFLPDDVLQTDLGEMTAAEASVRKPSEIFMVTPFRVQDGPFDDCEVGTISSSGEDESEIIPDFAIPSIPSSPIT